MIVGWGINHSYLGTLDREDKMNEPPLQANKVWAVMLYSNSGDVIGGVRTAPHLFRILPHPMTTSTFSFVVMVARMALIRVTSYIVALHRNTADLA